MRLLWIGIACKIAAAGLASAGPAPLAPEVCAKRLPSAQAASKGYREYYSKFVDEICRSGPASQDAEWQSCVLSRMASGMRADDISVAHNDCIPAYRKCLKDLSAAGGASKLSREFCKSWFGDDTLVNGRACVVEQLRLGANKVSTLRSLCSISNQPCVSRLRVKAAEVPGRPAKRLSPTDLDHVAQSCNIATGSLVTEPDEQECLLAQWSEKTWDGDARRIERVCRPENRYNMNCILEQAKKGAFKRSAFEEHWRVEYAAAYCRVGSDAGRACVQKEFEAGQIPELAAEVCQARVPSIQACLREAHVPAITKEDGKRTNVLRRLQVEYTRELEHADRERRAPKKMLYSEYCKVSDLGDRACVLSRLERLDNHRNIFVSDLPQAIEDCHDQSAEQKKCRADLIAAYEKPPYLGTGVDYVFAPYKVCGIPTQEVRDCMLSKMVVFSRASKGFEQLEAVCSAEVLCGVINANVESSKPKTCSELRAP